MTHEKAIEDELAAIARSIPGEVPGFSELRRLLGTLPSPTGPLLAGSSQGQIADPQQTLDAASPSYAGYAYGLAALQGMGSPVSNVLSGAAPGTQPGWDTSAGSSFGSDQFDQPTYGALSAAPAWFDFVRYGLYNARFQSGIVGIVPNGRTIAMPYWTASDPDGGAPILNFRAIGPTASRIQWVWDQIGKRKRILSDIVPVVAGLPAEFGAYVAAAVVAGSVQCDITVFWFKNDLTASAVRASDTLTLNSPATLSGSLTVHNTAVTIPGDAVFCQLQIDGQELTTHDPGNDMRVVAAWVRPSILQTTNLTALSVNAGTIVAGAGGLLTSHGQFALDGVVTSTLTGTQNDFDLGATPVSFLQFNGAADATYTGGFTNLGGALVGSFLFIQNITAAKNLTLAHNITSGFKIFCPGGRNIVLGPGSQAILWFDGTLSGWRVIGVNHPVPIARVYTANNTWVIPVGLQYITVELVGGGGQGGGSALNAAGAANQGGGGGGGGYARKVIDVTALSGNYTVTVGAGGSTGGAGAAGQAGANSSFVGTGQNIVGAGGGGGGLGTTSAAAGVTAAGGAGGAGTGGDVGINGGHGMPGNVIVALALPMAAGGASELGSAAAPPSSSNAAGNAPDGGYGGGGSGATGSSGAAARAGGAGFQGIVVVTEYY